MALDSRAMSVCLGFASWKASAPELRDYATAMMMNIHLLRWYNFGKVDSHLQFHL